MSWENNNLLDVSWENNNLLDVSWENNNHGLISRNVIFRFRIVFVVLGQMCVSVRVCPCMCLCVGHEYDMRDDWAVHCWVHTPLQGRVYLAR